MATDPSEEVRKRVCQALVMLLDVQLEKLMPHMNNVVQYMLMVTTDQIEPAPSPSPSPAPSP